MFVFYFIRVLSNGNLCFCVSDALCSGWNTIFFCCCPFGFFFLLPFSWLVFVIFTLLILLITTVHWKQEQRFSRTYKCSVVNDDVVLFYVFNYADENNVSAREELKNLCTLRGSVGGFTIAIYFVFIFPT